MVTHGYRWFYVVIDGFRWLYMAIVKFSRRLNVFNRRSLRVGRDSCTLFWSLLYLQTGITYRLSRRHAREQSVRLWILHAACQRLQKGLQLDLAA